MSLCFISQALLLRALTCVYSTGSEGRSQAAHRLLLVREPTPPDIGATVAVG